MDTIVLSKGKVTEEEFQKACMHFSSYSGIIAASSSSSYERFLQITLGYIHSACASGKNNNFHLREAVKQVASIINGAEWIDMRNVQSEIDTINQILAIRLSKNGFKDILNSSLEDALNIDYCNDLYEYYRNGLPSTVYLEKTLLYYVLDKEDIIHKSTYKVEDFVEYLVEKLVKKKLTINLPPTSIMQYLDDIIDGEIKVYKSSKSKNPLGNYPSLAKALLLNGVRENLLKLIREYDSEPKFVECLNYLLFALSDYDIKFLKRIKVSVPIEELKDRIVKTLCELFSTKAQVRMALYRRDSIREAAAELYDEKINMVNITPEEIIEQLPSDFIPKMMASYKKNDTDENPYAKKLSAAIAECCVHDGQAIHDSESIQNYLDKFYGKSNEKASGF